MDCTQRDRQDPGSFLKERRPWLAVGTVDHLDGSWSVIVTIDGSYGDESWVTKAEMVRYFEGRIAAELGIDLHELTEAPSRAVRARARLA